MFKNKLNTQVFFDFIHSSFFKVIGISLLAGFFLSYLIYITDSRGWTLGFLIISALSLIVPPDKGAVKENSLLHEDNKFSATLTITLFTLIVTEILLFQSAIFNFKTVKVNVVITKQSIAYGDNFTIPNNARTAEIQTLKKLDLIIKYLVDNDAKKSKNVIEEQDALYTVKVYNANDNSIIETYIDLDYNHSLLYKDIESITLFKKYVPFLDFGDSYKYNYAIPKST